MTAGAEHEEPALEETVQALRAAYRESPDSAFVLDPDGRFLMVNATLCAFLRVSESELLGRPFASFSRSTDSERVRSEVARALGGTTTRYRTTGARLDGEHFLSEVTLMPLRRGDEIVAVAGTAQDLTRTEADDTAARRSEEILRLAGRIARFGGWSVDATTRAIDLSEGARHLLGIPDDVVDVAELATAAWGLHPADELPRVAELLERCVTLGEGFELESVMMTTTGERLTIRTVGEAEYGVDGSIIGAHGAILDVTAAAADRARLAEQAALLDTARDAMLVRELDGTVRYWNRAAHELYGWSADEAIGRSVYELIGMDDDVRRAAVGELTRTGFYAGELEQHTRDGRVIVVDARWQIITDPNGNPRRVFAVNSDITEYRREQESRQRAQRLESLGTLAGGIAHDLNNVLTPILMSVQLLAQDEVDPDRKVLLATVETAVKRGAEMTRQVLTFARGVEGRRIIVDIDRILDDLLQLTRDVMPRGVAVSVERGPNLPTVIGDPTQLLQVLVNLVTNARDALNGTGRLAIRAEALEVVEGTASVSRVAPAGRYLQITVEDTGHGMAPEVVARVFEPFYTTKALGRGTGLGLATSLAIVEGHGGYIQVESEPERGTRFTVGLPAVEVDSTTTETPEPTAQVPRGEGEVILVVDDEEPIRVVTARALEAHGYRVLLAGDGREAIDLVEAGSPPVDLVLTDMMMPVMDGAATSAYLEEHHPNLPIIAASGLSSGGDPTSVGMGIARFIAKPYSTAVLLASVGDTLREHRDASRGEA